MDNNWNILYDAYDKDQVLKLESLNTLGNGYFATRGAHEECNDDGLHYPGTYLAGGYDRLKSEVNNKVVEYEDLVNWPNWLLLKFKPEGGEWIELDNVNILKYNQILNLREGYLDRTILIKDRQKRETEIKSRRFVHMTEKHLAGIQWKITPMNWEGKITIHSALDGTVVNNGVKRYRELQNRHFKVLDTGCFEEDKIFIKVETVQSEVKMVQAARTNIYPSDSSFAIEREAVIHDEYIAHEISFEVKEKQQAEVEKIVAIYTSRDRAIADPLTDAQNELNWAPEFNTLIAQQIQTYKRLWDKMDVRVVSNDPEMQRVLRLHIFQLFQTASLNTFDLDAGIPSRGWNGEGYRGHILWDELFILPFLNLSFSELSRSLLMYRYRRLKAARQNAFEYGYKGAMYPWQSGSNGREETSVVHLNPKSGRWTKDNTHLQRHVNAAIAYNVWKYFEITDDYEFLSFYGGEMILDIAVFWDSKTTWSEEKQKYEITQVVGPDEYHTQYPYSNEPGLNNNAYTNVMVIWVLKHALKVFDSLDDNRCEELREKLQITKDDITRWERISKNIFIPLIDEEKFIISQFEGFEKLKDLDWDKYHKKYGDILRLDRILEDEEDDVNLYKAVKQADVLMLFYLFSVQELTELFERSGYKFPKEAITHNIEYYQEITSHGSTLSKLVHSWIHARSNRDQSWNNYRKALVSDFKDIQGGTTGQGIHLGAMAGTVDIIQRCYTGLEFRDEAIWFQPCLPEAIEKIAFGIHYRCHWIQIELTKNQLKLYCEPKKKVSGIPIKISGKRFVINPGEEKTIEFNKKKTKAV